jgi:phage baseplate assembly protein W
MDEVRQLGQGVRFPPGVDEDGRWAWSAGASNVRESIQIILQTDPQERVMEPAFGGGLRRFLFQPNVPTTHRLIQEAVVQALGRWERRIDVESVDVFADPDDPVAARIVLRYRVIATGAGDQLALRVALA